MNVWIHHHRKQLLIISVLTVLVLVLLRIFVFHEVDENGIADRGALVRALFDGLITTILVTLAIAGALRIMRPPIDDNSTEIFLQPYEIANHLKDAAANTKEWFYLGHTGRYIRSQILPIVSSDSFSKNELKRIRVLIISPLDDCLCEFYAEFRNNSRSIQMMQNKWSLDRVRRDLLATVLCMIELQQGNSMLEVDVGFLNKVSLFRIDLSSSIALITQEDPQEPAARFTSHTNSYRWYRREIDLAWRQCSRLSVSDVRTRLDLESATLVRDCLEEAGVRCDSFDDEYLKAAAHQAKIKKSPYVH